MAREGGVASINQSHCLNCGRCLSVYPQNTIECHEPTASEFTKNYKTRRLSRLDFIKLDVCGV